MAGALKSSLLATCFAPKSALLSHHSCQRTQKGTAGRTKPLSVYLGHLIENDSLSPFFPFRVPRVSSQLEFFFELLSNSTPCSIFSACCANLGKLCSPAIFCDNSSQRASKCILSSCACSSLLPVSH